ncbi:MAG: hypothetical protein WDZ64_00910 [Parcubacteria group bacterium]
MKYKIVLLSLAVVLVIYLAGSGVSSETPKTPSVENEYSLSLPNLNFNMLSFDNISEPIIHDHLWNTFENYLLSARTHDLETVRSYSYQLSETCLNPDTLEQCYELMDEVYAFGSALDKSDFTNLIYDERQAVLYSDYAPEIDRESETEWFDRTLIYFAKDETDEFKLLALRVCSTSNPDTPDNCINTNIDTRDIDNNGWWDSLEALFY